MKKGNYKEFKASVMQICATHKLCQYDGFNLFKVMHHITDEKRLHSRFIAFLINPVASHGQGTLFLEMFLRDADIEGFDITNVSVSPAETPKKKDQGIDIIIQNDKGQAIIIENKIYADNDSKRKEEATTSQLLSDYDKKKEEFNDIRLIYLSLYSQQAILNELFAEREQDIVALDYVNFVSDWLQNCLDKTINGSRLRVSIEEYAQVVNEITNDYKLALRLEEATGDNLDFGYDFWIEKAKTKGAPLKEEFNKLRWHVIFEFMTALRGAIQTEFNTEVSEINEDDLRAVIHRKTIRAQLVLSFIHDGATYYLCNDAVKGFTIGSVGRKVTKNYQELFNGKFSFSDFTKRDTFNLINDDNAKELLNDLLSELHEYVHDQYVVA